MARRSRPLPFAGLALSVSLLLNPAAATAADLPPIRTSPGNTVAECVTPGRLMAFLKSLNPNLDPRYDELASHYMRHGEALGVRWDYAFFQMLLETGHLTYKGDVRADQNNFAGLGATGKGNRGERFPDIGTGVRAHIEHVVMYSGERVENPVAERTRNIQDWNVLTSWQRGFSRPITFADLSKKWAPTSRRYARDIQSIGQRFFEGPCREPDPRPELVAAIRGTGDQAEAPSKQSSAPPAETPERPAAKSVPPAATASPLTSGLSVGAAAMADAGQKGADTAPSDAKANAKPEAKPQVQTASMSPSVTLLNATASNETVQPAAEAAASSDAPAKTDGSVDVAALPGAGAAQGRATQKATKEAAPSKGSCRVWTASYGGTKAIIIKAEQDATTNYTVLDVNEGAEKREADAYINAYAKGGQQVGEFSSQSQALEKAFELCPEG